MNHGSVVMKIISRKLERRRRKGRPRLRCLEDVEKDLREMMVKIWRQKAVASVIKEAKYLRGP
jgi:hypothetical protein